MKMLGIVIPAACVILFSILLEFATAPFKNSPIILALLRGTLGILAGLVIILLIRMLNARIGWEPFVWGPARAVFVGAIIGLLVSFSSGIIFHLVNNTTKDFSAFPNGLGKSAIANISFAFLEEVGFRGGLVNGLVQWGGKTAGIAGGSVPFGLAHLAGRLFGQPVGFMHVIGTTLAGLLLSLVYLRYGLWAAISCHWVWNTLCGAWVRFFDIPKQGGMQVFEGAWTTSLVLLAFSIMLAVQLRGYNTSGQ